MPTTEQPPNTEPSQPPKTPWEPNLHAYTIGPELHSKLKELIDTARADLRPRNFPERHLVDDMAMCKWRQLRVLGMQTAIYRYQESHFCPPEWLPSAEGEPDPPIDPREDIYWLAQCHAPERQGVILAALARLETRYHRQFCASLRLLTFLRRVDPLPKLPETVH